MKDHLPQRMAGASLSESISSPASHPRAWAERRTMILVLLSLPLLAFLVVPVIALLLRVVPADLFAHIMQPAVAQAISLSIVTTTTSLLVTILFGTPFAFLLARRAFYGRHLLETLIDLP